MSEFGQKKKFKSFLYSPTVLIILAFVVVFLAKGLFGVYQKEQESSLSLARSQTDLDKLSSREQDLTQSINYLKTDAGVEAEIRSKFRVAKDGESMAVIIDNDASGTDQAAAVAPAPPQGFWQRLMSFFSL